MLAFLLANTPERIKAQANESEQTNVVLGKGFMKLHFVLRAVLTSICVGACFIPAGSMAKPRPPLPPWPEVPLQHWNFDAAYWASQNDPELSAAAFSGLAGVGWSGFALQRDVAPAFPIVMPGLDANGRTNLAAGQGSVRFWFSPSWSSAGLGGKGPGYYARFAELVVANEKAGTVAWSLYAGADGSTIFLSGQNGQVPRIS